MQKLELDVLPQRLWQRLQEGRGPWRTPVLATASDHGGDARTVVVREVDIARRRVVFFTNRDSRKQEQLATGREACLLVFDAAAGMQWRLYGEPLEIREAESLDEFWQTLAAAQRSHYGKGEAGRANFAAWAIVAERFHVLLLDERGNAAAEFAWQDGRWHGRPVPA